MGAAVGLAYLRADGPVRKDALEDAAFEVDVGGVRVAARVTLTAPLA